MSRHRTIPRAVRRVRVPAGGDLQRALDTARPGDRIELQSGATYTGPFRLRRIEGDGWIVVTSAGARGLPAPGHARRAGARAAHGEAARRRRARSSTADRGRASLPVDRPRHRARARHVARRARAAWRRRARRSSACRTTSSSTAAISTAIPRKGSRRGIALNARRAAVVDSYLADFKEAGADSQAIAGWNGPGPFTITNNYLEAAGENVMFGGADPAIDGLVPSDIVVTRNHLAKPLRWRSGTPGAEATAWTVKNLFELKNARRVRRGRQPARIQLAGSAERVRDAAHGAQPGRRRAVVGGRGRHVHRTTSCGTSAPASTSWGATTSIRASRRGASRSPATCSRTSAATGDRAGCSRCSTARSDVRDPAQHRVQHRLRRCSAATMRRTPGSCSRTTSPCTTRRASPDRARRTGRDSLERYFPGAVGPGNVLVGGNPDLLSARQLLSRHRSTPPGS